MLSLLNVFNPNDKITVSSDNKITISLTGIRISELEAFAVEAVRNDFIGVTAGRSPFR